MNENKVCRTCANWSKKQRVMNGRVIDGLFFCPVLGARGTYTTGENYCQYWQPKIEIVRDEIETR